MEINNEQEQYLNQPWPDIKGITKRHFQKTFSRKWLYQRLPILQWAPNYRLGYIYQDVVAGITVGLTAIPQGMANAVIAGLEPQYGLYSELIPSLVYVFFGSCKPMVIGPTAILALMIQQFTVLSIDFAIFSAFISGLVLLLLAFINFGFLVQFISLPVTAGFITAAAFQIGSVQVKSLLGIPGRSSEFLDAWIHVFQHIDQTKLWDSVLGVGTIIFLFAFQKLRSVKHKKWSGICKALSLGRNALAVVIGTALAFLLTDDLGNPPFAVTGDITPGFPPFAPPPISTTTVDNETLSFIDMLRIYGASMVSIPFVAMLEIVAVAKAFSKGKPVDATQELFVLGLSNLFGSFFSGIPVTGSLTRTSINQVSGVQTQLGGIATIGVVVLSIGFLTETFEFIPKTTLAAVIITAMLNQLEFHQAVVIWKTKRIDLLPFIVTFIACLLVGLEIGILIGIVVNLTFILYNTSRPKTNIYYRKIKNENICIIVPDQSLVFSSAENLKSKILKYSTISDGNEKSIDKNLLSSSRELVTEMEITTITMPTVNNIDNSNINTMDNEKITMVIVDGSFIQNIDVTVANILETLMQDFEILNKKLIFWNWNFDSTSIVWRLNRKLGELFYKADTIDSLLEKINLNKSNNGNV